MLNIEKIKQCIGQHPLIRKHLIARQLDGSYAYCAVGRLYHCVGASDAELQRMESGDATFEENQRWNSRLVADYGFADYYCLGDLADANDDGPPETARARVFEWLERQRVVGGTAE